MDTTKTASGRRAARRPVRANASVHPVIGDRSTYAADTPDWRRRRYSDGRQLIASRDNPTPLVRLNRVVGSDRTTYLKLEWFNPFGSIKDRTASYLLRGMEARGELAGRELVEPTSGNTGIALAALAAVMGIRLTVTVPSEVPEEKQVMLRMLGAEVWPTPDDVCPVDHPKDGAIALAHSIANSPRNRGRYAMPNQYANPDNVRAHNETTGPEIWEQTEGRVRTFVAGYGTCGTITGVGKCLYREEGLLVGPSTGAIVHAITTLEADDPGLTVGVSPDGGFKYASYFAEILGNDGQPPV